MRLELINIRTNKVIYSYNTDSNEVTIYDERMKSIMQSMGIAVPYNEVDLYGSDKVKYGDEKFHEAFYNYYFPVKMNKSEFAWQAKE